MWRLDFHPLVELDLTEAAGWYEHYQPGLGSRFLDEVQALFRRLPRDADIYAVRFADIRRVNLPSFPHGIFYFTAADTVAVLAVIHGHRDFTTELEQRRKGIVR